MDEKIYLKLSNYEKISMPSSFLFEKLFCVENGTNPRLPKPFLVLVWASSMDVPPQRNMLYWYQEGRSGCSCYLLIFFCLVCFNSFIGIMWNGLLQIICMLTSISLGAGFRLYRNLFLIFQWSLLYLLIVL